MAMSVRNTVSFTRLAAVQPLASQRDGEIAKHLRCLGREIVLPTTLPSRSSAVWPAMKMMRLALTSTICE